jgi:hypothetical protein
MNARCSAPGFGVRGSYLAKTRNFEDEPVPRDRERESK